MDELKVLEVREEKELFYLTPTVEQKQFYDVTKCVTNAISSIRDKNRCAEALQKLAYLSKDKVIFSWNMNRVEDHPVSLIGCGKPHYKRVNNLWTSTGLFIERVMNDFGFNIIENYPDMGNTEIIVAQRMPHFVLEKGKHPYDYPYHSVVTVPLDYEYFIWLYAHIKKKQTIVPGGWGKTQECKVLLENFIDWKYNPIWWCKTLKKRIGGVHRSYIAPKLGRSSIEVLVMRCWWRPDASPLFDDSLLYDWGWKQYKKN